MTRYASATSVSVERSKGEIERLLTRYGATRFVSGWSEHGAVIGFVLDRRTIRFNLPLPDRLDPEFRLTDSRRRERSKEAAEKAWEQACRSRWRALLLTIKAKLEAAEVGISTIEDEFLPWTVLPSGRTVADELRAPIAAQIASGRPMPLLLEHTESA